MISDFLNNILNIKFTALIIPGIMAVIFIYGMVKGVDVFGAFVEGVRENLLGALDILPALMGLMLAVGMFQASGALDIISYFLRPFGEALGFPSECLPLALIRPISGSGALAVYENLLSENHPDSLIGKVASVLMGSTETTFYTIAVYFAAVKTRAPWYTLPCALAGDVAGFIGASILVNMM